MKTLLAAALFALAGAAAQAATFTFSFDNEDGAVAGTVSGTIVLPDGDGTFAATSVSIDAFPSGLGIGAAPVDALRSGFIENTFTVVSGAISDALFFGLINGGTALSLDADFASGSSFLDASYAGNFGATGVRDADSSTLRFSAVGAAIPLPASLPLVLAGLGGLALLRRRA